MRPRHALLREYFLPAVLFFTAAIAVSRTEWFQGIENITLDMRTRLRARFFPTPSRDEVVLVAIDQDSLNKIGRWPWPRRAHGQFLAALRKVAPQVVAWDILFDDPNEEDTFLARGIELGGADVVLGGNTVEADLGQKPDDPQLVGIKLKPLTRIEGDASRILAGPAFSIPKGKLAQVADVGFVDTPPEPDGVRRLVPMVVQVAGRVYPTLSLRSVMAQWRAGPDDVCVRLGEGIEINTPYAKRSIPIDESGAYLVNYRHGLEGVRRAGYAEVLDALQSKELSARRDMPELTARILMVGQTADGLSDFGPSPFSPLTPLVLVHINVIENVLGEDYARRAPAIPVWMGMFAVTLASLAFFSKRPFREQGLFSVGLPLIYAGAVSYAWARFSMWVPLTGPLAGFGAAQVFMLGRRVIAEQRAKEQIKGMFGSYLAPALVNRMADSGVAPQLGGHEEEITAFFSDIQGYSTFSEKLPAKQLVDLLNEYLTACTDIVQAEGGSLDKYIGDAIVAMYGAPLPLSDHAYRACASALRIQSRLRELRAKWRADGEVWPEGVRNMQTRIGINSGPVVVGNMGSRSRFNYTMTGDNVNLAARMESGAKQWGVFIMLTDATRLACEARAGDRILFRPLGRIVVKGRTQAVPLFEAFAFRDEATQAMLDCVTEFSAGLDLFHASDWDGAWAHFAKSAELEPHQPGRDAGVHSNPSRVYLRKVEEMRLSPPPDGWDGIQVMHEK